jgi:hypothetical protein
VSSDCKVKYLSESSIHKKGNIEAWNFKFNQNNNNEAMAKYSKSAQKKVAKVMREKKAGTLKSGRSGKKVTSRKKGRSKGSQEGSEENCEERS